MFIRSIGNQFLYNALKFTPSNLKDNKVLRIATIFFLYFSQGLPVGIWTIAIPTWLVKNGYTASEIGSFIAIAMLPWATLKLLNGPLIDNLALSTQERRRPWILSAQCAIMVVLLLLVIIAPTSDQLFSLLGLAVLMNVAFTFQDTAVDGLAVDMVPENEYARTNAVMFAGQIAGTSVSAAVAGYILTYGNIRILFISAFLFIALVFTFTLVIREHPCGRQQTSHATGIASKISSRRIRISWRASIPRIFNLFRKPSTTLFVVAYMLTGLTAACIDIAGPIYAIKFFMLEPSDYSEIVGFSGIVSGVLGICVFGVIADKTGVHKTVLIIISVAALILLLLAYFFTQQNSKFFFVIYILTFFIFQQAIILMYAAKAMNLASPAYAATHFAIFVTLPNLARILALTIIGRHLDLANDSTLVWFFIPGIYFLSLLFFMLSCRSLGKAPHANHG